LGLSYAAWTGSVAPDKGSGEDCSPGDRTQPQEFASGKSALVDVHGQVSFRGALYGLWRMIVSSGMC